MSADVEFNEDQYAERLAAWDEAIATGRETVGSDGEENSASGSARLAKSVQCLKLLRQLGGRVRSDSSPGVEGVSASLEVPEGSPPVPRNFGRFTVLRELGRGGYGVVFLARDSQLHREVALKVPHANVFTQPDLHARFKQEARAAAGLDHPNIVQVYDAGAIGPICYIAFAFCPGVNLAEWLAHRRELVSYSEAATLIAAITSAVAHAHRRGVYHRDLKPANIILHLDSKAETADRLEPARVTPSPKADSGSPLDKPLLSFTPRITDFGLAKMVSDSSLNTRSGAILGTPSYMAPEQVAGKAKDGEDQADIYSLGAILYQLLAGHVPFQGNSPMETLQQVMTQEPVAPRRLRISVPRDLETICLKCLEKDPCKRYVTAEALAGDLNRFLQSEPIHARPLSRVEKFWRICRRKPLAAGLATALVASILYGLIGISLLYTQSEVRRKETERALVEVRDANTAVVAQRDRSEAMLYLHAVALAQRESDSNIDRAKQLLENCRPELRSWEWYFLNQQCHAEQRTLRGHRLDVRSCDFSPDGRLLATSDGYWKISGGGEVLLWDLRSGTQVKKFPAGTGSIMDVAFHPGGKLLASAEVMWTQGGKGQVKIWNVETGEEVATVSGVVNAFDVEFSPNGRHLVAGSGDGRVH